MYYSRSHLFKFQAQFPANDPKLVFEGVIQFLTEKASRFIALTEMVLYSAIFSSF